jgi:hypothetical protein
MSIPLAIVRSVPPPRKEPTLGETPLASIARSQSPKRRHDSDALHPHRVDALLEQRALQRVGVAAHRRAPASRPRP